MIRELQTRYGTMFVPDTDYCQYSWLECAGVSPEDEQIELVQSLLKERPKGVVIDVGANLGVWTLALAPYALWVWAFEPQKRINDLLLKSIFKNEINATALLVACGDRHGTAKIADLDPELNANFGGVGLNMDIPDQPNAKMKIIEVVAIDDYLAFDKTEDPRPRDPVTFIKIDVEGYEEKVLIGARKTIERCHPLLIVEWEHPHRKPEKLRAMIEGMGYVLETHQGNWLGVPIRARSKESC